MHTHAKPVQQTAPRLAITWRDDQSPAVGYLVVHDLVDGVATGGCRMRPGCTLREVEDLAYAMSTKTAAFGLPVGGAKGGIDFDPKDPRSDAVLRRYLTAIGPYLERTWVTAGDLGVSQHTLDAQFAALGLGPSSYHAQISRSDDSAAATARVRAAMAAHTADGEVSELIAGYGVARAAVTTLAEFGLPPAEATLAVQGFGTIGGATALYAHRDGVTVVAVSDAAGTLFCADGLDVAALLPLRNRWGEVDRSALGPEIEQLPREAVLGLEVDVLVPAAVSYALTQDNHDVVRAKVVVEGANAAATHEAELELAVRDIAVVPDFIANAGGVAWTWWILLGDDTDPFVRLDRQMSSLVHTVLGPWWAHGIMPRQTALDLAVRP